ncbi:MAG: sodium/calcium exchanger rane region [Pseudonocardiales bacterium]|nr:sodium/calcium exchanger rane region [Jatrophihabitantaceae bacterium]MCW2603821.1 sodium/calcium exchanger rane region [Pseudonocardiales bacterium]
MSSLPSFALLLIFVASAVVIWGAGIKLSDYTDVLAERLHLGEALGGLVLLAVATNLPEIAITASAALSGQVEIAVGNLLGGIALQTVVLVAVDAFGVRSPKPLTYMAASLTLLLEAALVVAVLMVVIAGSQLPAHLIALRLTPGPVLILVFWIVGLRLIAGPGSRLPWTDSGEAPESQDKPRGHSRTAKEREATTRHVSTARAGGVFGGAALLTLVAGVAIERSGESFFGNLGLSGVLFGATVLAAATSLPEVSTGLAAARRGDYKLAMGDIFGGNAFLPVLFLLVPLISGKAVLPYAQASDIYLTALGALLTIVYLAGVVFRPQRQILRMGVDSLAVLVLYVIGIIGLIALQ